MLGRANYSKLIIGDTDNPFAEIEPFEPGTHGTHKNISLTSTQMGELGAIFQHIPGLASNILTATSNTYIMRFSPEIAKGIADGTLSIMNATEGGLRAIAVNTRTKEIVKHATLIPASSLHLVSTVTVVWQALAMVTLQHYLPEIKSKLENIQEGLNAVKDHMESKDYAILQSSLKQIKEISLIFESPDLDRDERIAAITTLKGIERDCGEVYYTYSKLMNRESQKFEESDFSDFWKPKFDEAIKKGLNYINYAEIVIKAIFVQLLSVLLRCSIPGNKLAKIHALEVLHKELNAWLSLQKKIPFLIPRQNHQ